MAARGGRLLNVDTDDSLAAVLELVEARPEPPDALLITGDIAGDGAGDAYQRFAQALEAIPAPSFWLPGNHDDCDESVVDRERFIRTVTNPHWLVVMLDSQQTDEVGGILLPMSSTHYLRLSTGLIRRGSICLWPCIIPCSQWVVIG
jgi:Icc protein